MASSCRTYLITTYDGKKIALWAISAKEAEYCMLAMRPDVRIAMIEEIPPLPEDPKL